MNFTKQGFVISEFNKDQNTKVHKENNTLNFTKKFGRILSCKLKHVSILTDPPTWVYIDQWNKLQKVWKLRGKFYNINLQQWNECEIGITKLKKI